MLYNNLLQVFIKLGLLAVYLKIRFLRFLMKSGEVVTHGNRSGAQLSLCRAPDPGP